LAKIAPFKGIRYNQSVTGELSKVTSPPYDIISPQDQVYYHKLHPNNYVRLVLGEDFESDCETSNRFTRAKGYLDQWLADGVFKEDSQPAIYIYQQLFERNGEAKTVRGFTCAVKIHEYEDRVILPHEWTLAKPKSQLAQLIRQVKANLDCVYGLYADAGGAMDAIMDKAMAGEPIQEAVDKSGVVNRFWAITDPVEISKIVDFMSDKQIAIADGHHRYETALAYRNEVREQSGCSCGCCEQPSDYVMMTIINVYEKDMTIDPTHRVLGALSAESLAKLDSSLAELFDIKPASKELLLDEMAREGAIGMYRGGEARILKPKVDVTSLMTGAEPSRKLELNVLHQLILEKHLGIGPEQLRNQTHIIYTRDANEAMRLVDSGERQLTFLVNPIPVKSVLDIAAAGDKMPQKATYFYPKLLSGLVLRKLN